MRCGLLGRKLCHSYSPTIHSLLGNYSYELFEVEPELLGIFLQKGNFAGLNVTMPYKQAVIPYLDELSPVAKKLGAVNTIVRRDGKLIGHNTDYFGFRWLIEKSGLNMQGKKALVLGSGGASKTCAAVLEELGSCVCIVSRSGKNNYDNMDIHADILVNATPVGMFPNTGLCPVKLSQFTDLKGVLDVIYNPARTQLLLDAETLGIPCSGGLGMLVAQAKEASEWFTGIKIPDSDIDRICDILKRQMENIILIGMPGCGKSTVGKALASKLGRAFADLDICIEEKTGMSIPEILTQQGESYFRQLETEAAREYGQRSGLVIATGGGIVTQARNYPLLHQNGQIIWLERSLDLLPTAGRPLSKNLRELFENRRHFYEYFADYTVDNNGKTENTLTQILAKTEVSR